MIHSFCFFQKPCSFPILPKVFSLSLHYRTFFIFNFFFISLSLFPSFLLSPFFHFTHSLFSLSDAKLCLKSFFQHSFGCSFFLIPFLLLLLKLFLSRLKLPNRIHHIFALDDCNFDFFFFLHLTKKLF